MPCWVIRVAHQVVQRHVEIVGQGDEHIIGWFAFTQLILLDSAFTGSNARSKLFLRDISGFSMVSQMCSKNKHDNISTKALTRSIERINITVGTFDRA